MSAFLIQCVVVLYQQHPGESKGLSSLFAICSADPTLADRVSILVQDNSPVAQEVLSTTSQAGQILHLEYRHSPSNPGLAEAYNDALGIASERDIPWLLLLDQDTSLTREFLLQLLRELQSEHTCGCAFVPQLVRGELVLSPQYVGKMLYTRMPRGFYGFTSAPVVAFNSAACLSVAALRRIGGFPAEFWLDYLDHMVFHSLQQAGGQVFVLNSQLDHNLSVADIDAGVSHERYGNILHAEWLFVRKSGWGGGAAVHRVRLLKRALLHFFKLKDKGFSTLTLRAAFSRPSAKSL